MKRIAMIAGVVLFAGVNASFASGPEGLRYGGAGDLNTLAVKAAALKAAGADEAVPPMPGFSRAFAQETGLKAAASAEALSLNIKARDGIRLKTKVVYMSSSDSLSCTHASFSDGVYNRVPNVFDMEISAAVSGEMNRIKIGMTLNDNCRSQAVGMAIEAVHPAIPEDSNRIAISLSASNQDSLVQRIIFTQYNSPYIGIFYGSQDAKVVVGPNGLANAEVSLQTGARTGGNGINLVIKGPGELVGTASGVFQATSNTPACMTTSWNEGSVTKIPKTVYPEFKQKNGLLTIPAAIDSSCGFKRVGGGSLNFSIPGKAPAYNAVTLFPDGGGAAEQRVVCKKVLSGPKGNEPMLMCFGDIRLNAAGDAVVNVALE